MIYLLYILLVVGFVFFFLGLFPRAPDTISVFGEKVEESKGSVFSPILGPFAPLNKWLLKFLRIEQILLHKIYIAKWKVSPAEFFAGRELLAVFLPLILYLVFNVDRPLWLIVTSLGGFVLPAVILNSKVKRGKYAIVRVLPETIDLLGLCVGAGLDFMAAVRWVIEKVKMNPLIEELTLVLKEINVGKPRIEALKAMSKRLDIPDVTSFVRTLVQADRMGTPVEEAFRILAEDTRMRRFHRGERMAMKAPIKMLVPLIFCILPVIMIIVAGPILVRFITQGAFGQFTIGGP